MRPGFADGGVLSSSMPWSGRPSIHSKSNAIIHSRLLECHSDSGKGEELEDQPVVNPRTDSMVHLLLQGLQSGDKSMLNAVIFRNDPAVIDNTVRRLPLDAVQIFVKELQDRYER